MPINVDSAKSTSNIQSVAPQFGHDVKMMSADQIIAYVMQALGNIGDQLNDYKEVVMKQQADAKEIREALVLARQLNANGGDFTSKDMVSQGANYNEMMTKLSHHLDNPSVKAAYESMLKSYGGYSKTDTGEHVGGASENGTIQVTVGQAMKAQSSDLAKTISGTIVDSGSLAVDVAVDINGQDQIMDKEEMDSFVNSLNDALSGINSGNELMMMNLQNLMQVRNQISQFGSNNLKSINDTMSGLINNLK